MVSGLASRRLGSADVMSSSLTSGFGRVFRWGADGVEPDRLIPLINEELARTVDAYVIDEIGKMECHCRQFIEATSRLLEGPVPLVASIALRGGGFIAEVKKRPDVQIVEVTQGNRDALPGQIAAWVKQRTAQANTL